MCTAFDYRYQGRILRAHYPNPQALLPVALRSGGLTLVSWGRRENQAGPLPVGGWADYDAVRTGAWGRWGPKPVKLIVFRWMAEDRDGSPCWYDLRSGQAVQGLLASSGEDRRVYVVTVRALFRPPRHERQPRVLQLPSTDSIA